MKEGGVARKDMSFIRHQNTSPKMKLTGFHEPKEVAGDSRHDNLPNLPQPARILLCYEEKERK